MIILEACNITKSFPGVVALKDVDVAVEKGKIHCIIGENGAGKSTLVKILTGVYQADNGQIKIEGETALYRSKLFEKVAYVPQELDLFKHMSVAENLFMPFWKSGFKKPMVNRKLLEPAAVPWLEKFQINAGPGEIVKNISVSNQQLLQIARATVNKYFQVLILDEPTTSLTQRETARLFEVIRQLKMENKAIIFISHKLDELFEIGDAVTILRNGEKVGESKVKEVDKRWIINKMSGRDIDEEIVFRPENKSAESVLEVADLSGQGFSNISFQLRKGEILGFAGLVGAGRSEIMQTIFGFLPAKSGRVRLEGKPWRLGDPHFSIRHGLFYLPEERKQQGILPLLSIRHNIGVSLFGRTAKRFVISAKKEQTLVNEIVQSCDIKTSSLEKQIMYLSGGNQQKAIIGRALYCAPKTLIFDEPTKGIDVGTKNELYKIMKDLATQGISIILISSELEELMKCSNRIITIYEGKKVGEFETENAQKSAILSSIIGEP